MKNEDIELKAFALINKKVKENAFMSNCSLDYIQGIINLVDELEEENNKLPWLDKE